MFGFDARTKSKANNFTIFPTCQTLFAFFFGLLEDGWRLGTGDAKSHETSVAVRRSTRSTPIFYVTSPAGWNKLSGSYPFLRRGRGTIHVAAGDANTPFMTAGAGVRCVRGEVVQRTFVFTRT